MKRIAIVALAVLGGFAGVAKAGKSAVPWCSINPIEAAVGQGYVVHAEGLPILVPINVWVIRPDGTVAGSPLGSTPNGTFSLSEASDSPGVWTYAFSGVVRGKGNMNVYATCSMQAY